MRILLVPSAYYPSLGGVEEVVRQLGFVYKKKNIPHQIITSRPDGTKKNDVVDDILVSRFRFYLPAKKIFSIIRFFIFFPLEIIRLLLIVIRFKPSIINVHCASGNLYYATIVSKITKIPLLLSTHGETLMDASHIYQKSVFMRRSLRLGLKQANYVTACSEAILDDINQNYGDVSQKATVIHNGIDMNEFKQGVIPVEEFYIFATGRLSHNKGFDLLIEAYAMIKTRLANTKLLIGGSGEEQESLQTLINKKELSSEVKLLGRLNRKDLVRYMKSSMFVVMPSRYEPFGIVALEAMAAGKSVLSSNKGGPIEFMTDGDHVLFVDPEDVFELSNALVKMLHQYKFLEKGNAEYAKGFSWDIVAEKYLKYSL